MNARYTLPLVAAALAPLAIGCHGGSFTFGYHDHHPPPHVRVSHVCTRGCNHYWNGDRYVTIRHGHVHGPDCGHVWRGDRWIVIGKARAPHAHRDVHIRGPRGGEVHVRHVHGPNCGHVFDRRGSKWIVVRHGHVHRPGCGHAFINGRWTIRY